MRVSRRQSRLWLNACETSWFVICSVVAQRRHHYEQAFERYLRTRRIPYISVDEARKSLIPASGGGALSLKNFDFLIYGQGGNMLVEVKGRKLPRIRLKDGRPAKPRMENWVPRDDVEALQAWSELFGPEFEPMFVFLYQCEDVPPDGLFAETVVHRGRWYTPRCVTLSDYAGAMRSRSLKWGTVCLSAADFDRLSRPFEVPQGRYEDGDTGNRLANVREPVFEVMG